NATKVLDGEVYYQWNSSGGGMIMPPWKIVCNSLGNQTLTVWANDMNHFGNIAKYIYFFTIIPDFISPNLLSSPSTIFYTEGASNSTGNFFNWTAGDKNPDYYDLFKNGILIDSSSWDNNSIISINVDKLHEGIHNFTIMFYDELGNNVTHSAFVTSIGFIPEIHSTPDGNIYSVYHNKTLNWNATDVSPDTYVVYRNGTLVASGEWDNNSYISVSLKGLMTGFYNYTLIVFDEYGKLNVDTSFITLKFYLNHAPISINGNLDFYNQANNENWIGNGTILSPFLITGYNITGNGLVTLIEISNTNIYFIIKNNLINGGLDNIYFFNVTHGQIRYNQINNSNNFGIYLFNSLNNSITDNINNNSNRGLFLKNSDFQEIINNTIISSGYSIHLDNATSNIFSNNNFTSKGNYAVLLEKSSKFNSFLNNSILGGTEAPIGQGYNRHALRLDEANNNNFYYNLCNSTSGSGISLGNASFNVFYRNIFWSHDIYGMGINYYSYNNSILENNITAVQYDGITLYLSSNNTISKNYIESIQSFGIYAYSSSESNLITHNIIFGANGVWIDNSLNNYILYNKINVSDTGILLNIGFSSVIQNDIYGSNYGIKVYSGINLITKNIIAGNTGILINGGPNIFDLNLILNLGNYDIEFISGIENNFTMNDMFGTVLGIPLISDCSYTNQSSFLYNQPIHFNLSNSNGILFYKWDDQLSNSTISPWTIYPLKKEGNQTLTVWTYDTNFNMFMLLFQFYISVDDIDPIINQPDDILISEGSTDNILSWIASDEYSDSYVIFQNGIEIDTGKWFSSFNISVTIDNLPLGLYNLTIVIYDRSGNYANDTVLVYVIDDTNPIINHPNDILIPEGTIGNNFIWIASDNHPDSFIVYQNGTIQNTGSWTSNLGIIIILDDLSYGFYNFTIRVTDISGNNATDTVFVTINALDVTTPSIDHPDDFSISEGTSELAIEWSAMDANPSTYVIYQNGSEIDTGTWLSGESIILSFDTLSFGLYNFTIIVTDVAGNYITDTVFITVIDDILPVLVYSSGDLTIEIGITENITWTASDRNSAKYIVFQNNIEVDSGNWTTNNPIFYNIPVLSLGYYNFTIKFLDLQGNFVTNSVVIHVIPVVTSTPTSTSSEISSTSIITSTTSSKTQLEQSSPGFEFLIILICLLSLVGIRFKRQ
ncbi:MAG: NosD domain-containing protein, partial [Candidatus Hodarchaeales archaeon]